MSDTWPSTHASLIAQIKNHDNEAWNHFYNRYRNAIFRFCSRRFRDPNIADELGHRIFIKVLSAIRSFDYDPSKSFRSYMKCIARSAMADFYVEINRQLDRATGDDLKDARNLIASAPEDLSDSLQIELHRELLKGAEQRVQPTINQKAWQAYMALKQGEKAMVIAERLGISRDSVYQAKHRIVQKLQSDIAMHLKTLASD